MKKKLLGQLALILIALVVVGLELLLSPKKGRPVAKTLGTARTLPHLKKEG